jgi:UDP-2,4-diacetamido-2,4,6-trideoxy-beta-L-altropyranose hydrolase
MSFSEPREQMDHPADIRIRQAAVDDAALLWQWANEPGTRANSLNSKPISWDVHQDWYAQKLRSTDCRLWIMEHKELAIAQIRYDRISADEAQISLSVARQMRGKGVGSLLLKMTLPMAARELRVASMRAIALSENKASRRVFEKASFTIAERQLIDHRECLVLQRRV